QETHISQQSGSGPDEGTGSKPGVPDVPSDDSEEELSDVGVESIFTTTSSPIVSLETPTPIMTHSTIAIITTSGEAPIPPPIIPSIILENIPTLTQHFALRKD
nr:hypothetical protein [Tanacetum cinerariifolium]